MSKEREATVKEIIEAIVNAMVNNLEPMYTKTLAPGLFDVYLREADYLRLEGIFKELHNEAEIALDERIALLNKSIHRGARPLFNKLYGMIKPRLERIPAEVRPSLTAKVKLEGEIVKPRDGWQISFHRNEDVDSEPGDIEVEVTLVMPAKRELGGGMTTKSLRILYRAGATVVKEPSEEVPLLGKHSSSPRPATPFRETVQSNDPPSPGASTTEVLAVLKYRDNDGEHVYEMTKTSIVVGRGGTGVWTDIKLNTLPDVSREHLRIKRDEATGDLMLKDVSLLGTKIDGRTVIASMKRENGKEEDQNIWIPLPKRCRIGLADVLTIEFDGH